MLKLLEFVIGIKSQYVLIKKIKLLACSGTASLNMRAVRESAEDSVPNNDTAAEVGVAVIEIV